MMSFPNLSLKNKLILIILGASTIALLLASTALVSYELTMLRRSMRQNLFTLAAIVGDNAGSAIYFSNPENAREILSGLSKEPHIAAACVYDEEGVLVAQYVRKNDPTAFKPPAAQDSACRFEAGSLVLFHRFNYKEKLYTIYIQSDLGELRDRIRLYATISGLVLVATFLITGWLSFPLQKIISQPILNLAQTAYQISTEKNYAVRVPKLSQDEIGRLTDGFNEMLTQIQARDEAIHESRELYQKLALNTNDLPYVVDLSNARVEWHGQIDHALGYAPQGFPRTVAAWTESIHPEDREAVSHAYRQSCEQGAGFAQEYRIRRQDGTYVYWADRGQPVRNADGRSARFFGACSDITNRKQAEQALRLSRQQFLTLVNSIEGIVWEMDVRTRQFSFVSAQAQGLLGYPPEMWLDNPAFWEEHIHAEDRQMARDAFEQSLDRNRSHHFEYRMITASQQQVWIRHSTTVVVENQNPVLLCGIWLDITEQKKAERELDALHRQLLETSRLSGMAEVATGVLHNVGNVLNSVNVSTTLVYDRLRKSKIASFVKVARLLREQEPNVAAFLTGDPRGPRLPSFLMNLAHHLEQEQAALIEEMKALAGNVEHIKNIVTMQQSYAKVSGVVESLPMARVVEEALQIHSSSLQRHEIQIVRAYAEVPPLNVEKHKVLQILLNLI